MLDFSKTEWDPIYSDLNKKGYAVLPGIMSSKECRSLVSSYASPGLFRSTVNMKRYRFGEGEYKYFRYPLPPLVQTLREEFYPSLRILANEWMRQLGITTDFPRQIKDLLKRCGDSRQVRPTPLLLRYEAGGFNTLHQDLYGEVYFPFQIVVVLTQAGRDHQGGEFVMTSQIPRSQSKVEVIQPVQGDAIIFTTNFRPVKGTRGYYRAKMKHGISEVRSGVRFSLGIIFHDAL